MWLCPALLNLVCGKSWPGKCDLALMHRSLCISIDKQIHLIGSYGNWSSQSSKGWAESHPLFDGSTNTLSMPLQQRYHLAGELQTATGYFFVDSLFFFFYAANPLFLCCHMPKNGVKIKRWRKKKNVLMCQVSQLLWKKMIGEFVENKWLDSIADTSQVTLWAF